MKTWWAKPMSERLSEDIWAPEAIDDYGGRAEPMRFKYPRAWAWRRTLGPALRYLSIIASHKWFVWRAGRRLGAPAWRLLIHDWSKLTPTELFAYGRRFCSTILPGETVAGVADGAPFEGRVMDTRPSSSHDGLDCLVRCEKTGQWWAWSFEVEERVEVDAGFAVAWLHHVHLNAHHWEHWVPTEGDPLPMPEMLVREMVADWLAASRAYDGAWPSRESWPWLSRRLSEIEPRMHPDTRQRVTDCLDVYFAFRNEELRR